MSNVAKLKKRALEYEQKKQFDKALETYAQILEGLDEHVDEADVALYNRVGDLLVRRGDVAAAVDHYEKAVDLYTDGGFFNNAIALCNKILRNAPGRNSIYYKLGKISAKKGFVNDAKQNFLEYADRMQRAGELEEAFRALKEFADLCPDQDDIRLMLADQLVRKDRKNEAIEQLQLLYEKFQSEGRTREARATVDRMKALDPELEPKSGVGRPTPKVNDLVFLDVNFDDVPPAAARQGPPAAAPRAPASAPAPPRAEPAPPPAPPARSSDLPFIDVQDDLPIEHSATVGGITPESSDALLDAQRQDAEPELVSHVDAEIITGFEQTALGDAAEAPQPAGVSPLDGLEPTIAEDDGLTDAGVASIHLDDGLGDITIEDAGSLSHAFGLPDADDASGSTEPSLLDVSMDESPVDESGSVGGELTFIFPGSTDPELPAEDESDTDAEPEPAGTGFDDAAYVPPALESPTFRGSDPFGGADVDFDASLDAALGGAPEEPADDPLSSLPVLDPGPPRHEKRETAISSLPPLPPDDGPHEAVHHPAAMAAVDRLRAAVELSPNDFDVRRQLAEALLEEGERDLGLAELEHAMLGFETTGNMRGASAIAEEMIRVEPTSVRYHQKRVEYAVRANDKTRLVDAYLSLAECLFGAGQLDKSRAVYGRVLELNPQDERAHAALAAVGGDETLMATPPRVTPVPPVGRAPEPAPAPTVPRPAKDVPVEAGAGSDATFVNLADWLREDDAVKNTRMVVDVGDAQVQEQVDFAEMLSMFKQGVAANVDETDHESHYDLGVAYKEMGLLDEAISEFQKALRGAEHRVRTYEALGQCFVEKRQYQIALTILTRALGDQGASDDQLVGVLYLLGYACEALGRFPDALRYYERVFAVDIQFRDIGDRLAAVERKAR